MEEAVRELGWGIKSHCEDKGTAPERVAAAYEKVKAIAHDGGKPDKRLIHVTMPSFGYWVMQSARRVGLRDIRPV